MGKADLHIHTTYSYDGTATVDAVLAHVAGNTDLNVIAITDHDEIDGALLAAERATRYNIEVIPGVEVSTTQGHLLALFVTQAPPPNRSLIETIACVAKQGGICIAAHPGGPWPWCLQEQDIQEALQTPAIRETLLGVETYNASLPNLRINCKAAAIGARAGLANVHNSDAHILSMIGTVATCFPGRTGRDFVTALRNRTTWAQIDQRRNDFIVSFVARQVLRYLGLVHSSSHTPGGRIALRRLGTAMRCT